MLVTLVVVLCHMTPPRLDTFPVQESERACVEETVVDSDKDSTISWMSCMMVAEVGITKWMSQHPNYFRSVEDPDSPYAWHLDRWKCIAGTVQAKS